MSLTNKPAPCAPLIVAKIEKDHLSNGEHEDWVIDYEGKEFHYDAMCDWWGWTDSIPVDEAPKVKFKLFDDDGELYYSGWLLNDDQAIVLQFVLGWAHTDSGCTIIKVKLDTGWTQEIG